MIEPDSSEISSAEKNRIVFPGDMLSTAEEFMAGEGTYQDDENVYSSIAGRPCLDRSEMVASVVALKHPALPGVGDIIHGKIEDVGSKMVKVELLRIEGEGNDRQLATRENGVLHISNMDSKPVSKPWMIYKTMELIRARVIQAEPSIQLSTAGPELGTLKAYCRRCRSVLVIRGDALWCQDCEMREERKMAENYGLEFKEF